jgi:hypothetical protein
MILEVVLLLLGQRGATVELGTTAALLITKVLTSTRSEQTWGYQLGVHEEGLNTYRRSQRFGRTD